MKKIKLFPVLILSFVTILLNPFSVHAESGTCSDHGGVSCSAGAGIYGQAICNDGWDGSSVQYNEVQECNTSSINACPRYLNQDEYNNEISSNTEQLNMATEALQKAQADDKSTCGTMEAIDQNFQNQFHVSADTSQYQLCLANTKVQEGKYSLIIAKLQHDRSCIQLATPTPQITQQGLDDIVNQIKSETHEQKQEENCKIAISDQEYAKRDPLGYAKYKNNLIELGIPMAVCNSSNISSKNNTDNSTDNIILNVPIKKSGTIHTSKITTPTSTIVTSAPHSSIIQKIKNFFLKLKFW